MRRSEGRGIVPFRLILTIASLLILVTPAGLVEATAPVLHTGPEPVRAAFYYPWFPEAWDQDKIFPYTNFHPFAGYYRSDDPAAIAYHIAAMRYAGISAGIASWWGIGSQTDRRLLDLLDAGARTGFQWAIYDESEGVGDPSVSAIRADLDHLAANAMQRSSYWRINGRPVVFVYGQATDGCAMAQRWHDAAAGNFYLVLKVFPGYAACARLADSWHQYAPAKDSDQQPGYSFTISPGFWKKGDSPLLERDLCRWANDVRAMTGSGEPLQLITTFNEWGEGTAVEGAREWMSPSGFGTYLDVLHTNGELPAGTACG